MHKISSVVKGGLMTGAALVAALSLGVSPASASGTWTVSGGGNVSGTSTNATLHDGSTAYAIPCSSSTLNFFIADGTGLPSAGGPINSVSWSGCTDSLGLIFGITAQSLPWSLNFTSYTAPVASGTVSGVKIHVSGSGCTMDLGGSTPGSPATVDITYNNTTKDLKFTGSGNLHAWNVSGGCLGLINYGDSLSYTADYYLTTLQVTSP